MNKKKINRKIKKNKINPCKKSPCKSDPSSESVLMQKYFCAIQSPRVIQSSCAILLARANLTPIH